MPHELSEARKQHRMEVSFSLFLRERGESFLDRVVTCEEKWIFYNRKRSAQWLDKGETPRHMPKPVLQPRKTMFTVWWTAKEVVHYRFLPPEQPITADSCCPELEIVHQKVTRIRPVFETRKPPVLLHDNAKPHVALLNSAPSALLA